MSTLTTIQSTDAITTSRTDINNNFSALNSEKLETSVLDTDTTLAANSDSKVATQKAVKAYVDAGGNVNASTTTKGIVEEATAAEVIAGTAAGATGARLFVNPSTLLSAGLFKFGGDGSDGALAITSGTTTIDLGSAQVVEKNYTSISITGTGALAFSNPHASGTTIILKSLGTVTLTSSAAPMIDASGLGAQGGGAVVVTTESAPNGSAGTNGILPFSFWDTTAASLGGAGSGGGGSGGNVISAATVVYKTVNTKLASKYPFAFIGSGGSSGGARRVSASSAGTATSGAGGRGGAFLSIECGGALNFTTTGGISVAGAVGGNGTCVTGDRLSAGGGGGGAGGFAIIRYNSLTSASGTITVSGGASGTGAHIQTGGAFSGSGGGGGGGSYSSGATGGAGASGSAGTGGAGGNGFSIIEKNTELV